ncbi:MULTISPECIES: ABC transporter ATP-binding protein [Asticcacaulis]|uniref:ABC transporter ATP-binding protein n=1 Tax=Asticcacaulis TaxID=76890 RepID=UPI001AE37FC4|nr:MULTISPECIES: ATP-binding cassette domain-containing protein [Asticcacaulis]MBP2160308.1 putative ABC transport system ATP-binding protein [Asticcacaulis solisilvae]MDR6801389.1 putative ABC transport system ATP-binding protein [Asticcacaulis sp. BE141]
MPETILQTRALSVERGRQSIGLPDLTLHAGGTLALCGPSGSGKTSLLLALAGLVRPRAGEVIIDGQPLWRLPEAGRARLRGRAIGFVFADYRLIDSLSVMDNLQIARASAHLARDLDRATNLLERLGVAPLASIRADRLSQGQMQRVALARALMNRPALLLADEPTAALDEAAGDRLIDLLLDLGRDEGIATVIATHERRLLPRLDDTLFLALPAEAVA